MVQFTPITKIILLSLVLAAGFLLVILGSVAYKNWLPIISAVIFFFAYIPTVICNKWSSDDFMSETSTYIVDFGKFFSAFLFISGFGLSLVLLHSKIVQIPATVLTLVGGTLIYSSLVLFTSFFENNEEDLY